MEKMNNNKISFLDVMLEVDTHSGNPIFSIFRKPTSTNSYIHFFSSHPQHTKIGIIQGQFNRALIVCSPNRLNAEISFIRNIFKKLSYPDSIINKAYHRAKKNFYRTTIQDDLTRENRYNLKLSHRPSPNIRSLFKNDIRIIQCIPHTVGRNFTQVLRGRGDMAKNRGIYSIDCSGCEKKYIGETDDLKRRIYQHKYSLETGDRNSALHRHRLDHNHFIDVNTHKLLSASNNVRQRRLIVFFN